MKTISALSALGGSCLAMTLLAACRGHMGSPPVAAAPTTTSAVATAPAHVLSPQASAWVRAIVDAADRTSADRALDAGRHPAELLAYLGVKPGMRLGELGTGGGYTTELLARAIEPGGLLYAQNSPTILQRFAAQPWAERLSRPALHAVVRADREFEDPFPPEATNLDLVASVLIYHDTVWLNVDRRRMNRAVFAALRPGGHYAVVDHSARPGSGLGDVQTSHRIEESSVIAEIEAAGFKLESVGDFLRNPGDTRDWNDSPRAAGARRGTSDRFVLLFGKPSGP